jgi:hypothetical protein
MPEARESLGQHFGIVVLGHKDQHVAIAKV